MLNDIEKSKEEKENKEHYISGIEKQTAEQEEKISRANKSLRKVQKDINLYISKRDDAVLLQQVGNDEDLLLNHALRFYLEMLPCRKKWNCENFKNKTP